MTAPLVHKIHEETPENPQSGNTVTSTNRNAPRLFTAQHTRARWPDVSGSKRMRSAQEAFASIEEFVRTMGQLDRASIAVLLLLARDVTPDGLACTTQNDLAQVTGYRLRTVRRALTKLMRLGLIS